MQSNSQPSSKPTPKPSQRKKNWRRKVWIFLRQNYKGLCLSLKKVKKRSQILAVILILFWIAIILSNFVFRGSYIFEGSLIVKEMSFTYNNPLEHSLINTISGIQNLDIQGSQSQPLTLNGKFSSSDADLNQKLIQINKLTIEFPYPTSRLIFSAASSSQLSELSVLELRIKELTKVNNLSYNEYNQISFCLQSAKTPSEFCIFPDSLSENTIESNLETVGSLKLQLGQQPLKINLGMVNIPELGLKTYIDTPQDLQLEFISNFDELVLNILSPTRFFIDLPKLTKTSNIKETPEWIKQDIDVKDVNFSRIESSAKIIDELKTSSILQGEIRMQNQVIKLEKNQFLVILSDKPGIRKLRYIQIHNQSPQGLEAFISGESNGIEAGLYPEFPVQSIKPSLLSKYFFQEAVNAILAFIGALTAILLDKAISSK